MVAFWFSDISLAEWARDVRLIWSTFGDIFQTFTAKRVEARCELGVSNDVRA